jgi:hypothetical protein
MEWEVWELCGFKVFVNLDGVQLNKRQKSSIGFCPVRNSLYEKSKK